MDFISLVPEKPKKHPKCKGVESWSPDGGYDFDCDYGTTVECQDCKYCLGTPGRKDPAAKCNQL